MPEFFNFELTLLMRLVCGGLLGAVVGLERELRAKEAGLRTHFLVALGSALIMVISMYGFVNLGDTRGIRGADPARIAAQVVSGIGFIGAGAIMVQRRYVYGLTTAAGLWVVAGIGMAAGCGHYILATGATLLALVGLELFRFVVNVVRLNDWDIVLIIDSTDALKKAVDKVKTAGILVKRYKIQSESSGAYRISLSVRSRAKKDFVRDVINLVAHEKNIKVVSVE